MLTDFTALLSADLYAHQQHNLGSVDWQVQPLHQYMLATTVLLVSCYQPNRSNQPCILLRH